MLRKTLFFVLVACLGVGMGSVAYGQPVSGAIFTSDLSGNTNVNIYVDANSVYLNGGPGKGGALPDGTYYFQVTTPSGSTLLSTDPVACRQVVVAGGLITGVPASPGCQHVSAGLNPKNQGQLIPLAPFTQTSNDGGVYKAWLVAQSPIGNCSPTIADDASHLIFDNSCAKTDNFKVNNGSTTVSATIAGTKYYDTNANGILDITEVGLPKWTINFYSDINSTPIPDPNNPGQPLTVQTDSNGFWAVALPAGTTFYACEVQQNTYLQTGPKTSYSPNSGYTPPAAVAVVGASPPIKCWTATVGSTDITGLDFGNVQPVDLAVTKTATTSFTRTYLWNINKNADKTLIEQVGGGSATANYTVTATETGFTDSAWQVTGTITVTNGNAWDITVASVTDSIDNGGSCNVTNGTNFVVHPGTPVVLNYSCSYSSAPSPTSGLNTATANWNGALSNTFGSSKQGTAQFAFGDPAVRVNKTIHVTDAFNGGSPSAVGTATAVDVAPYTVQTFTYSRSLTVPTSNCITYSNTAAITETSQTATASVEVCGPAKTGALTMGFWQNKNGQGIITAGASTGGVCNSGTWLRAYAPFQDLSSPASCSQVAAYVANIIKAANASGSSMNAMLKAQMLSTALDVYFSSIALGGNPIAAPGSIGAVQIDLTRICAMIDSSIGSSCSGSFENVSAAFGGATKLPVSQILSYAASQSNGGGSIWYANVKGTQQLAKDTFDAINNQVAFAP